jgi:hypothetical protein
MIKMIMSVQIANTEIANIIIPKALRTVGETTVQRWPGTDISVGSNNEAEAEAALALIGMFSTLHSVISCSNSVTL